MVNRYEGQCTGCGGLVGPGEGVAYRGGGRRWSVRHATCEPSTTVAAPSTFYSRRGRRRVSTVLTTSGGTFYRNANGRCEDAPCCGCCTF